MISEACDADYVFDVHCDDDSLVHIFTIPQQAENMQQLANWTGAAATLLAEDSGGGSFDEVWPAVWLRLAGACPDKPVPLSVVSCTLEYRGQFDTFDNLNRQDAQNLYGYFQEQGLISGKAVGETARLPRQPIYVRPSICARRRQDCSLIASNSGIGSKRVIASPI